MKRNISAARRGLTLIELVVVIAILAVLGGLVIPKLSFLQSQAGAAAGAATSAQLVSNIETYKTSSGSYPIGLDTLLDATTTTIYDKVWTHAAYYGNFGLKTNLTLSNISTTALGGTGTGWAESFGHAFGVDPTTNSTFFYDHDTAATDYSNSGTILRVTSTGSLSGQKFAFVSSSATDLIKAAGYPSGAVPSGVQLVAFGIGPNSTLKTTLGATPKQVGQDSQYYARYIAIFAIYQSGKSGRLKTVVDSYGNAIDSNIASYDAAAPTSNN